MIRHFSLASITVLLLSMPSAASAYWPYGGYLGWGQSGYGLGYNYASNYVPSPPYYAIYPPVYYSQQITARPYGASPFAWPAGLSPITYVPQGELTGPSPAVIENPYVRPKAATSTTNLDVTKDLDAIKPAIEPETTENPFVAAR
jgi:hypothetical protein